MIIIWSLLGFIVMMGIIVTIHEWGHYQVAKWFDIKVERFSIGFGKPIYRRQGKETEFVIAQIPLGGYVKFADEREGPVAKEDAHRAFNRQSVYKKIAVVFAGPLINLLFAWLAFVLMYMIGVNGFKPFIEQIPANTPVGMSLTTQNEVLPSETWFVKSVNDKEVNSWQMVNQELLQSLTTDEKTLSVNLQSVEGGELFLPNVSLVSLDINQPKQNWLKKLGLIPSKPKIPAKLGEVLPNSPAEVGGLQSGDLILKIDKNAITYWQDFVKVVQFRPGEKLTIEFERQGVVLMTEVDVGVSTDSEGRSVGKVGVGVEVDEELIKSFQTTTQFGFFDAMQQSLNRSVDLVEMSLVMLKRMLIGEVSPQNLSGPISIAEFSGQAIQSGFISFISLLGLLSLSIGILNLLPIPVLDGGHLMFYFIEVIKGSPVSDVVMQAGQFMGLMAIVGLTILALFNDVLRIFHG